VQQWCCCTLDGCMLAAQPTYRPAYSALHLQNVVLGSARSWCMLQIAVHISYHKVKEHDRGMVVVGGSVVYGDLSRGAVDVDAEQNDVLETEIQAEEAQRLHGNSSTFLLTIFLPCFLFVVELFPLCGNGLGS
jgi:hypothetical protein